ncbi:MAG: M42 family metallopeptidase [Candidatus Thermoplasmatota archaeon]|uniref:M42 family metallopeptidase n=1 Tax=Candidatus Sysuiplasma superficiale TaxID=2823368 RepID=A0A8J8CEG3_9ARCH|nr:M42 family metallopeptidase [Candidatus Sysuiplasma superficiale]MCL5437258.1 M42 family metallopeptidase [Candidatus Thermoplasmatota archaeon]
MSIKKEDIDLLGRLSESFGPSGFERETARIVKNAGSAYSDSISFDRLGSVIFTKTGGDSAPKILLAGHMDEVGFVVTGIDENTGFLTFGPVGGWFDQVLLGHRVKIRTRKSDVTGVVASKPPHLLPPEEREKVVKLTSMYVDIGATSAKEAEMDFGVRIGDPIAPEAGFVNVGKNGMVIGKAFDDRIGTFVGLQVMKRLALGRIRHPNTVYFAATVQEEVGLRGAQTVSHVVAPDVAFALEVDIAGDVPGIKPSEAPSRLGKGPSILTYDASMIPNQELKSFVIDIAEQEGIPYQLSTVSRGGTDAGKFHLSGSGCPSIVVGVPTRHIHSHSAIANLNDIDSAIRLMISVIRKLDDKKVRSFTQV